MAEITGASILVRTLAAAGVRRIFTLSGNQLLPVYDACIDAGISLIDTRHEAAAAHMADAWAQLRDEPAVCLVSAGPGHTNALTAVANALYGESPVLWLSGGSDIATDGKGGFQEIDQVAIAAPACKAAWRATRVDEIPELIARAWRTALEGIPGPVHVTLPADLLAQPVSQAPFIPEPSAFQPDAHSARPSMISQALDILAPARRPVILANPSVARGDPARLLRAFGDLTGIPWFILESPRALNDPAFQSAGLLVREADVVLLFGPQDYAVSYTDPSAFAPRFKFAQLGPTMYDVCQNTLADVEIIGDAAPVLQQLLDAAQERTWDTAAWRDELAAARARVTTRLAEFERAEDVPLHPLRVGAETRDLLPAGTVVIQDGGEFSQWARWAFAGAGFQTLVNGKFAMIGPAIPFAIGAALARPGQVPVAFLGDGTIGFHGMEFDTAVRHGIPFVAVIGNDAGWAAERHRQLARYGPDRVVAADLLPTRYDLMVEALGGHGEFVERPEQLRPALERALACGKPACVNVLIQSLPSPAAIP